MLVKALVLSCLALASGPLLAAECAATVDSTDMMTFSTKSLTVSKSCKTFTLTLTHSGSLPRQVMGHNWVLAKQADAAGVASDGMTAGLDNGYLKPDDPRIIAHTRLIGGGEQDTVKFDVSKLDTGEQYQFICTYPGHIAMMKGALKLVD
jgi:azurin